MKKRSLITGICMLVDFVLWTAAVCLVDVRPIGPNKSNIGFASLNGFVHDLIGVHMQLYTITDWLGLVPLGFVAGFAVLGFVQWIQRKHILKVDSNILILGAFYILVLAAYVLFEMYAVNYRPVLIEGRLEASYPSSTSLLTLCVMPTAWLQIRVRVKKRLFRRCALPVIVAFTAFMVIGRLVSGVHWFTDIIGAILLSAGLVRIYSAFSGL